MHMCAVEGENKCGQMLKNGKSRQRTGEFLTLVHFCRLDIFKISNQYLGDQYTNKMINAIEMQVNNTSNLV